MYTLLCSWFSDSKPLIDLNRQSLNSLLLFVGREKVSKNPHEIMDPGVGSEYGRLLSALNDYATP